MKPTAGLMCLGSLYAGALWIEFQTVLLLGTGGFLFADGSALGALATALWRAPEGYERRDGFHVAPRDRRATSTHQILPTACGREMRLRLSD